MTLDLSLRHIIDTFSGEHSFPRELIIPKPRLVVTVKVPERSAVTFVRIFWTGPSAGSRDLYRRPFKHEHAADGSIILFFSRKWHTERSGYRAEIGFKKFNAATIQLAEGVPTIHTQADVDALPEIKVQENIFAKAYILDMIPSSCPESAQGHSHWNANNLIGHSLFLADHHHRSIKNVLDDVIGSKKRGSKRILQDFLSNYPGLNLGVEHIRDFIGAIFDRLTSFPEHLVHTVERLAQLPAVLEHILKDLWAYINSLIAAAEHKFLSNKEGFIYPPPPVHISKDGKTWQNWGNSLKSNPAAIYSDDNGPHRSLTSLQQIQEVIAAAKANKKLQPVRVFGSCHSWAAIAQTTGTLLDGRKFGWLAKNPKGADVFDQETVERYIDYKYLYVTPQNDLIGGLPTVTFPPGLATGTLERWIYYKPKDQQGRAINGQYSLGTTTYEDVFTMGGIVAAACHGTGRNYPSVSDWLVSVEFVDANSLIRRVDVNGNAFVKQHEAEDWSVWDVQAEFNETGLNLFKAVICNYGLFGVLWSLTIRIIEGFDTLFIAEMVPWTEVLDNTEQSRKNLNDLQNRSNSLEFFYYPFGSKGLTWEKNPGVYLLRHVHDTPENREALRQEGYKIVSKSEDYFLLRDLKTRIFSGIFYNIITKLLKIATKVPFVTELILPYVLSQMPNNLEYTAKGTKKEAISLPHWRANHSVNAVGAVENIRVLNIEWTVPLTFNDPSGDGLKHALGIHSHVIKSIHEAADRKQFPITVVAEIRFFRGSGALLAPEYDPNFEFPLADPFENPKTPYGGCAAPEMVTGVHNPWWTEFYTRMNEEVFALINNEVPVRNHLAKQYATLPNQFARLRAEFDREPTKPFSKFRELRQKLDPAGVFLPPAMHQFLDTTNPQYNPPAGYPVDEDGKYEDLQKS